MKKGIIVFTPGKARMRWIELMPRGRKPQPVVENPEPTPTVPAETPVEGTVKRRGRRTKTAEPINETSVLIDVVLRGRGAKGATPDVLHSVVSWARSVREEGATILSGRNESSRRQRLEISSERIARFEMNVALLNGVLNGTITLNVEENGELVFRHAALATEASADVAPVNSESAETEAAGE